MERTGRWILVLLASQYLLAGALGCGERARARSWVGVACGGVERESSLVFAEAQQHAEKAPASRYNNKPRLPRNTTGSCAAAATTGAAALLHHAQPVLQATSS